MPRIANLTGFAQAFQGRTDATSSVREVPLGTRAQDVEGNEYIYAQGVASCGNRDWVTLDEAHVTTRSAANAVGRLAVAMATCIANEFGWFQIYGSAQGNVLAGFADDGSLYLTSTAGSLDDTDVGGDSVIGAVGRSAVGAGFSTCEISYPFVDNIAHD